MRTRAWIVVLLVCLGGVSMAQDLGDITMALTGDTIMSQRLSPFKEPEFMSVLEVIRNADVAITNFESIIRNGRGFPSFSTGTYMNSPVYIADELKWAGFDMVTHANNHAMDYNFDGLMESVRVLRQAGIAVAGAGQHLAEAVGPAYFETPHGRVALIGVASTFPQHGRAGVQSRAFPGRPGVATLRFETVYQADAQTLTAARELSKKLLIPVTEGKDGVVQAMGRRFKAGPSTREMTTPNASDMKAIMSSIREGKNQADYVVVTIHCHEARPEDENLPADFLVTFAHAAIDEGASAFFAHGPHFLKGIEIYKGKPIFYSLGNYSMQNGTMSPQPYDQYAASGLDDDVNNLADFYYAREGNDDKSFPAESRFWESMIAVPTFHNGSLVDIKLYPTDLGFGKPRPQRGRSKMANAALAKKIIDRVAKLSQPYGTQIRFENGIGVIRSSSSN